MKTKLELIREKAHKMAEAKALYAEWPSDSEAEADYQEAVREFDKALAELEGERGMSLRDRFAGQCWSAPCPRGSREHVDQCAAQAYAIADALIAEGVK